MESQKKRKSIQDIFKARQQISFVGREDQIKFFRSNLELPPEDRLYRFIFNICGQGGVGKTTLLQQFYKIAEEVKCIAVLTNDNEKSVLEVMEQLAKELEEKGHRLRKFTGRYKVYRQKQQELKSDPEAPQGFSAFLGKNLVKNSLHIIKQVPVVGAAVDFLNGDALASQAGEWSTFVAKKLTDRDEIKLVREPVEVLTPIFLEEISKLSDDFRIILFFDDYERTDNFLDRWLLDILQGCYGEVGASILFVIAGCQELDPNRWANYEGLIARLPLKGFTEEEAQQYLKCKNITNSQLINVILRLSGGLPLLMATLTVGTPNELGKVDDSSNTALEQFLKWLDEPKRRQIVLHAAIPQFFNRDILFQLLGEEGTEELFDWLKEMPFVKKCRDGWAYHDVVRSQMLRNKCRYLVQNWTYLHEKIAEYYEIVENELELDSEKAWQNETWQSYHLQVCYHRLCQAPHKNLSWALNQFLAARKNTHKLAMYWGKTMVQAGKDTRVNEVQIWGEQLLGGLKAYEEDRYKIATKMLTDLLNDANIEAKWRSVALDWRGSMYALSKQYSKALDDFTRAINLAPEDAQYFQNRAITYVLMQRYSDAIRDFDRAVELDFNYIWVLAQRGYTYRLMKRYKDAIKDFDRAIELDPNYIWVLANRSITYRLMKCYKDAIKDFYSIIKLDPNYTWVLAQRGYTYRLIECYSDAIEDFDRAIELDPNYTWALAQRGYTYHLTERYSDAIEDFDRAIELDPNYTWVLAQRGETYRLTERYSNAIEDFDRAIELDPNYIWVLANRGITYHFMKRYSDALQNFDCAIKLDPNNKKLLELRGYTYHLIECDEDALKDFNRVIELDPEHFMEDCSDALKELNRLIELNPKDDWNLYVRALIYKFLKQPDRAKVDLTRGIKLAKARYEENPQDCFNTFNLALYYLAGDDVSNANHLYDLALSRNYTPEGIRKAIHDLYDFLTFSPNHKQAQTVQDLLQAALVK